MGAHPLGPSTLTRGGQRVSLAECIARDPARELGSDLAARFGARLPFLMKVLAAEQPLSLQAHPDLAQARDGFAREDALGIPRTAAHRNYKDASHKPELLCALTPFDALLGFRDPAEIRAIFRALGAPALSALDATLDGPAPLRATFESLMAMGQEEAGALVEEVTRAAAAKGGHPRERDLVKRLSALHPGDRGVVTALMLNLVRLEPGDAIYLAARTMHAYLGGVGVEIMASSDNVLRGGLTPKHVDVAELARVLAFEPTEVAITRPVPAGDDPGEHAYATPAEEFRLSRLVVNGAMAPRRSGPEILFVSEGAVELDGQRFARGGVGYVPASDPEYTLAGTGVVFRATVGGEVSR
jgi:mannose-6-phosphate isomerase